MNAPHLDDGLRPAESDQDQPRSTPQSGARPGERALVLGGGGSTGNAWLIGVIAGLFDAGLDVTTADLTIGTSAGSTAAAQIAGATPTELLAAILAAAPQQRTGPVGSDRGRVPIRPVADHLERIRNIIASAEDAADMRRRMGAAALDMDAASDGSWQTQWRATVAARLPSQRWPQRTVLITAVDAQTGEPVVFDRHSGVDLADAVAASCSSGLPYRIGDSRYIDGGYRSQRRECRSGSRIRAGAGAVTIRRQITDIRWTGACISQRRSTSSARAAAESRRSSRTATPSTCSAPMRWICRCVRPLLEPVTTKAEPLPSSSPNSGADALRPFAYRNGLAHASVRVIVLRPVAGPHTRRSLSGGAPRDSCAQGVVAVLALAGATLGVGQVPAVRDDGEAVCLVPLATRRRRRRRN